MIGMSIPFWLIGATFFVVGLCSAWGSALAIGERHNGRSQVSYKRPARFFIWCMLFAAAFYYIAAVIATRGL